MTKRRAPRHLADAKGAGRAAFGDRAHLTQNHTGSKLPLPRVAQGDRIEMFAGPGQRLVPAQILNMLRKKFPRLIGAVIENGDEVYLGIVDKKGRLEAWRYRASPEFLTRLPRGRQRPDGQQPRDAVWAVGLAHDAVSASRRGGRTMTIDRGPFSYKPACRGGRWMIEVTDASGETSLMTCGVNPTDAGVRERIRWLLLDDDEIDAARGVPRRYQS